ncbi:MAG: FecR domain-containing protein [Kiritimatiellae bacterium]|nr:FecR domain-containing protein [Kiritimatiellia bacterium]
MTDMLEHNVSRLIRRCHEVATVPAGLEQELLTRMYRWQDARLAGAAPAARAGEPEPRSALQPRPWRTPARPAAPARPWGWWVTGVAAAILAGVGLLLSRPPPPLAAGTARSWQLARVHGTVRLHTRGGSRPADTGGIVEPGTRLQTGPASLAALAGADSTSLQAGANTDLTLGAPDALVHPGRRVEIWNRIHVAAGTLRARVQKRAPADRLAVTTPHAEVFVLGTEFTVTVQREASRVDVDAGQVQVLSRRSGKTARVAQGAYAVVGATLAVVEKPVADRRHLALGDRTSDGLLALYAFIEGGGTTVRDLSGFEAPLNLHIADPGAVRWLPGGGLAVERETLIASAGPALKINRACMRSNAITIEFWVQPRYVKDPPHSPPRGFWPLRIATISRDESVRNITFGQGTGHTASRFMGRLVTTESGPSGKGQLYTPFNTVKRKLHHFVFTRRADGAIAIFVDGRATPTSAGPIGKADTPCASVGGDFSNWDPTMPLALANELNGGRPWLGSYYLVALYDRALTAAEAARHYRAGVPARPASAQSAR